MEVESARDDAASRWAQWEDAVISLEPGARSGVYSDRPADALIAFVRICAHYFANEGWLAEGEILSQAGKLRAIPGVIIHGRLDLSCPIASAWELARAWPEARFHAVRDMGHQGNPSMRNLMLRAHSEFSQ